METVIGGCHPWQCDVMGHMNTRFHAAMFDDASLVFLGHLAKDAGRKLGWADVNIQTDFQKEALSGALLGVTPPALRIGNQSISYRHRPADRLSGELLSGAKVPAFCREYNVKRGPLSCETGPLIIRTIGEGGR